MTVESASNSGVARQVVPAKVETSAATISSDFDTFLKMLTAQARYQDPLEPIDSTEYAAQLAQFSMVEQQVKTNESLEALVAQLGSQNAASLSAWVGKEVRAETEAVFEGVPITVSPSPASDAEKSYLVVTNKAGTTIDRQLLSDQPENFVWSGRDKDGVPFANGVYRFAVESHKAGEVLSVDPVEIYATVTEAQIHAGEVRLVLHGGQSVSAESVSALRDPFGQKN